MSFHVADVAHLVAECGVEDNSVRGEAEARLHFIETSEGFCSCLLQVSQSSGLELGLRLSSVVMLKNVIRGKWGEIGEVEKKRLRVGLLKSLGENAGIITEQYSLCIAQIAGFDFPEVWPNVILELLTLLQGPNSIERTSAILSLKYVIEYLKDEIAFNSFRDIVPFLMKILLLEWRLSVEQMIAGATSLIQANSNEGEQNPNHIQTQLTTLMSLGHFSISCFKLFIVLFDCDLFCLSESSSCASSSTSISHSLSISPSPSPSPSPTLSPTPCTSISPSPSPSISPSPSPRPSHSAGSPNSIPTTTKPKVHGADPKAIWKWIHQFIMYFPQFDVFRRQIAPLEQTFSKIMCTGLRTIQFLQTKEPIAFRNVLCLSLTVFFQFLAVEERFLFNSDQMRTIDFEKLTVKCLTFLHEVINTIQYREREVISLRSSLEAKVIQDIQSFFTPHNVQTLCRLLITAYLPLTYDDVKQWECDPEELVMMELNSWQRRARVSAEVLLSSLSKRWPEVCVPIILQMLQNIAIHPYQTSFEAILQKDAIYNAIAIAGYELKDHLDITHLFQNHFTNDLQVSDPRYKIIHRRIGVVIENWFCIGAMGIPTELATTIFSVINFLLRSNDAVCRIWGSISLRNVIQSEEFDINTFLPFVPPMFSALIDMANQFNHNSIHIEILNVISIVVKKIGTAVQPLTLPLFQALGRLWGSVEIDHDLLRVNVLRCLRKVVNAHGPGIQQHLYVILPAISTSMDLDHPDSEQMLEDSLRLWSAVLACSYHELTEQMYGLLPLLEKLLQTTFYEHSKTIIHILLYYVIGGRETLLNLFGHKLIVMLFRIVDEISTIVAIETMPIFHAIVLFSIQQNPSVLKSLMEQLIERYFMSDEPLIRFHFLLLFCRLLILNENLFWCFFQNTGEAFGHILNGMIRVPLDQIHPSEFRLLTTSAARIARTCEQTSSFLEYLSPLMNLATFAHTRPTAHNDVIEIDLKESIVHLAADLSPLLQQQDPVCS
jgi:hypothetical protein